MQVRTRYVLLKAGYIGMTFVIRKASYFASAEELSSEREKDTFCRDYFILVGMVSTETLQGQISPVLGENIA